MPFIQMIMAPIELGRVHVDNGIPDELECVANHVLANIIRQLCSLSQHAETLFSDLHEELKEFFHRAKALNNRVNNFIIEMSHRQPAEELVQVKQYLEKFPMSSTLTMKTLQPHVLQPVYTQQLVARSRMRKATLHQYNRCNKSPMLRVFNQYSKDGYDCMTSYSDPNYFSELWYSEIKKNIEEKKKQLKQKIMSKAIKSQRINYTEGSRDIDQPRMVQFPRTSPEDVPPDIGEIQEKVPQPMHPFGSADISTRPPSFTMPFQNAVTSTVQIPPPPPPPPLPPPPLLLRSISSNAKPPKSSSSTKCVFQDEIRQGNEALKKTEDLPEVPVRSVVDVHVLMTKAFNIRRKAIKESDSEESGDDDDDF